MKWSLYLVLIQRNEWQKTCPHHWCYHKNPALQSQTLWGYSHPSIKMDKSLVHLDLCWRDNILEILKEKWEYAAGCFLMRCFHCASVCSMRNWRGECKRRQCAKHGVMKSCHINAVMCCADLHLGLVCQIDKVKMLFLYFWKNILHSSF